MLNKGLLVLLPVIAPIISSLVIVLVHRRTFIEMDREAKALDRKVIQMAYTATPPVLRRPNYRPRHRFPFRALRSVPLWVILIVVAPKSCAQRTPNPQSTPVVVDCARDDSRLARESCDMARIVLDAAGRSRP